MLKITILDSAKELCIRLEGRLSGPWVGELRQCWKTAASITGSRPSILDLRDVDFVDPEGQKLMADMYHEGVRLLAATPLIQAMVEEVSHAPGCGTVEEKSARRPDVLLRPSPLGRDPRSL